MHGTNKITILILTALFLLTATAVATPAPPAAYCDHTAYSSIQDAINHAPAYATVTITSGSHPEILTIDRPLCLTIDGTGRPVINPCSEANEYAVRITAPNVTLDGLDITNQGTGLYTTAVKISAPGALLQNCTVHDTPVGIAIWNDNCTIRTCTFTGCDDEAIAILGTSAQTCSRTTIIDCQFIENCDGIELQHAANTTIDHCVFIHNTHAGIDAIETANNQNSIRSCNFSENHGFGIYLAGSTNSTIAECSLHDDLITLRRSTANTLRDSSIAHVSLMDQSSLHIKGCGALPDSAFSLVNSQVMIQKEVQSDASTTLQHSTLGSSLARFLLVNLLARHSLKILSM